MPRSTLIALTVLALASAASAQPARDARGQLSLTYTIFERGVSHVSSSRYVLDAELTRTGSDRIELRVRGTVERAAAFLEPPGRMRDQGTRQLDVDATHRGDIVSDDDATGLLVRFDADARGNRLEWRCDRAREDIGGRALVLLRCAVVTPLTVMPWRDPAPAYLRATMVLAIGGAVRAEVSASPERSSVVTVLPAP